MRSGEVSSIRAKPQLRSPSTAGAGKRLQRTCHRVATVKRALRPANKLDAVELLDWHNSEVEGAAYIIHRDSIHDELVVTGFAASHEQRCQSAAPPFCVQHCAGEKADCL